MVQLAVVVLVAQEDLLGVENALTRRILAYGATLCVVGATERWLASAAMGRMSGEQLLLEDHLGVAAAAVVLMPAM